jgi:hypothetical protein
MERYSSIKVKSAGDCRAYLEAHGYKRAPGKGGWNIPWRPGSDSGAMMVDKGDWYDHVKKEGGSIVDLAMKLHGYSFADAVNHLGVYLNLMPEQIPVHEDRRIVKEYIYTDASGAPAHKTVRYEPKDFRQFRYADGAWLPGLNGSPRYVYNLPAVMTAETVYLVEGEKDADTLAEHGLVGTTVPMGAEKWEACYTPFFAGKHVVILRDNDDPGEGHAKRVAWELREVAKSIRCTITSKEPKGDVSDYFAEGGTLAGLMELIKAAPVLKVEAEPASVRKQSAMDGAAKLNKTGPLKNYNWTVKVNGQGEEKNDKEPVHLREICKEIAARTGGFPKLVGSSMFDYRNGRIRYITNADELFAWISDVTGHNVEWSRSEGMASRAEVYASLWANADRYEQVSGVPGWPARADVFYAHGDLPAVDSALPYFNKLVSFFAPATEADHLLIRVMFASPLYFEPKIDRPMWVIDSEHGQGVGKTKLAEMLAYLYGCPGDPSSCEPLWVDSEQLQVEANFERVMRRVLSGQARQKRVMLLDNVEGYLKCQQLASMVTQGSMSGLAPYARGEETRPNDLTFVMTSNNATMNRDLISRSMFIHLVHPGFDVADWGRKVTAHIDAHRLKIIAEIRAVLERGATYEFTPCSRFREWERKVLAPMVGTLDNYSIVFKQNEERKASGDGERERADTIRDYFRFQIDAAGFDPEKYPIWLSSEVLRAWGAAAVPGLGGRIGSGVSHVLGTMIRCGMLPELAAEPKIFPHNGKKRCRGMMWNPQALESKKGEVYIFRLNDSSGKLETCRATEF